MVLVTIFVTCPFVVRELVPVMLSGAAGRRSGDFAWRVRLADVPSRHITEHPLGAALWRGVDRARAIGEFGAVSVVSGSIRGETLSLPLQIELLEQDYNTVGSFTAAALLTLMAIITLFLKVCCSGAENQENAHSRRTS